MPSDLVALPVMRCSRIAGRLLSSAATVVTPAAMDNRAMFRMAKLQHDFERRRAEAQTVSTGTIMVGKAMPK